MSRLFLALTFVAARLAGPRSSRMYAADEDGRVSLEATAVPVRQILTEWGTRRRDEDRRRRQDHRRAAHAAIWSTCRSGRRSTSFCAASRASWPRRAGVGGAGRVVYDRILIMATSIGAGAGSRRRRPDDRDNNTAGRRVPPRPPNLPPSPADDSRTSDEQVVNEDPADTGSNHSRSSRSRTAEREWCDAGVPAGADADRRSDVPVSPVR